MNEKYMVIAVKWVSGLAVQQYDRIGPFIGYDRALKVANKIEDKGYHVEEIVFIRSYREWLSDTDV